MGREVVRVHPLFRAGAVIVLAAALLLVAENALVFTSTTSLALGGGLDAASPTDPSSANQTVSGIFSVVGDFVSGLSLATTLDLIGFALLGAGMALLGLGSRGIEIRVRFDGTTAPKSRLIPAGALLAAACFFGWVGLTTAWRSALTGSPTGDWTGIQSLFDADGIGSGSVVPASVQQMIDTFPTVTGMWMFATLLLIPAAVGILLAGAGFKRTTGLRAGGVGFLIFSILAVVGVVIFLGSIESLFAAVEEAFSTGGQGIEQAFTSLAVAMVVKLLVVPFWAIIGFSMLAIVALRLSLLRNGAVLLAPEDVRAIKGAGSAVAPPGALAVQPPLPGARTAGADLYRDDAAPVLAPAGTSTWSELGAPATGQDVVVQLPPQEPEK
jgi:hypothetical protein